MRKFASNEDLTKEMIHKSSLPQEFQPAMDEIK